VPVDLLGRCADYSAIGPICEEVGVPVLADAAEALGAQHAGRPAGSFGRMAVLSFNGNKVLTTSGGGMLLTDDGHVAERIRYLSAQARQPTAHYEHVDIGFNYRLSNVLAAIGLAQLERLDAMLRRRRYVREFYAALFTDVPGVEIFQRSGDESDNCWLTAVLVDERQTGWSAGELSTFLAAAGIESRPLWKPMHRQPVFAGMRAYVTGRADELFRRGLVLPSGSTLSDGSLARIESAICDIVTEGPRWPPGGPA
jgi:dTDP-4-amino-4,6-dideoxygalactose transaminase